MDPLTHGLLGATAAGACLRHRLPRSAWLIGMAAAMAPDLDIFLPTGDNTLNAMAAHRQFTHGMAFIPVGGLAVAVVFLILRRLRGYNDSRWSVIAAATFGFATHGLLDTCTSYGTMLLWPFSHRRFSWDVISIIDPLFTLPLLAGLVWSVRRKSALPLRVGLVVALAYLGMGVVQHGRAAAAQQQLAQSRGQRIERGRVMPTLGNLLLWRSLYEAHGELYADAVRTPLLGRVQVRPGRSLPRFHAVNLAPENHDLALFEWFADGYTAVLPDDPDTIGDMRYSMRSDGFEPIWGVRIVPGAPSGEAQWVHLGPPRRGLWPRLWRDLWDGLNPSDVTAWVGTSTGYDKQP